jgi:Trypsin-like peptidase domain
VNNFPSVSYIHQNPVAFRLTLYSFNQDIGTATGSVWRNGDKLFLVSNWHVLSGRNTYSGKPIDEKNGSIPTYLDLHYMRPWPLNQTDVSTRSLRIDLVDTNGDSVWFQHKKGQQWDLACVALSDDCPIAAASILPHTIDDKSIVQLPGTDIFIMGFPNGLQKQGGHPVWKRASIASHPNILSDELPITLVDTAGRKGMSGAPAFVVQYASQFIASENGFSNRLGNKPYRFAGIYSGRYGAGNDQKDEFSVQLGRIWWEHIIEAMLADPHPASWELKT